MLTFPRKFFYPIKGTHVEYNPKEVDETSVFVDGPAILAFSKENGHFKVHSIGGRVERLERLHLDPQRAKNGQFSKITDPNEQKREVEAFIRNNIEDWGRIKSISGSSATNEIARARDKNFVRSLFYSVNPNHKWDDIKEPQSLAA